MIYINDGDRNLSAADWIKTGGSSWGTTYLGVGSATPIYSPVWNGDAAVTDIGFLLFLKAVATVGVFTLILQEYAGAIWNDRKSTTFEVTASTLSDGTYIYFKFSSTHTETAGASNYRLKLTNSTAGTGTTWLKNSGATLLGYAQVTSGTGTPAENDQLIICGTSTAAVDNPTAATVTIDDAAAATYIIGADTGNAIAIHSGGKLTYTDAAAADHIIRCKGHLSIYSNGTLEIGTVTNPIPSTRILKIELNYSAALSVGKYGLLINNLSNVIIQGATITYTRCKLNTDEAVGQTVLGVDSDTGWKTGDEVCITGTTRVSTQIEKRTLAGDASATELTISAGLTNAHQGSAPLPADIGLLTRNIKIYAYNASYYGYIWIDTTAQVDIDYCEMYNLGANTTTKYGFEIQTTTGSCSVMYSSLYSTGTNSYGFYMEGLTLNNVTLSYNVVYKTYYYGIQILNATSGTNITISYNLVAGVVSNGGAGVGVRLKDIGCAFHHNTVANCGYDGIGYDEAALPGAHNNNLSYGNYSTGVKFSTIPLWVAGGTPISNYTVIRNSSFGVSFYLAVIDFALSDWTIFGNYGWNIYFSQPAFRTKFTNFTVASETGYTGNEVYFASTVYLLEFISSTFGVASGSKIAAPICFNIPVDVSIVQLYCKNCVLSDTLLTDNTLAHLWRESFIASHNHGNVAGRYKVLQGNKTNTHAGWISDQVTGGQAEAWARSGAGVCLYLDPVSTTLPLEWKFIIPCTNGVPIQVKMYVRKSAGSPTLTFNAVGNIVTTLVVADPVTLTTDWELYTSPSMTPTETGFIEIIMKAYNNASTGDIGIDDVTTE